MFKPNATICALQATWYLTRQSSRSCTWDTRFNQWLYESGFIL